MKDEGELEMDDVRVEGRGVQPKEGVSLVRMSAIMSLLVGHDAAVCKAVPS